MPSSQLYMINRKAVPKLARRRTVASTWHDIIRGIFTLRYRWPETSCDMKIWRLCPLTKLYIMSNCNEWSAGSPTRRTVDMTQPGSCGKYRRGPRCPEKNANKKHEEEEGDHHHHNQKKKKKKKNNNHNKENNNIYTRIYIYIQLATQSVRRVAYMMVTSVCSKREWTHLTLADSWWKPLTGNSLESYI